MGGLVIRFDQISQAAFLDKHAWEEELLQSFAPTVLTALLTLLIPLLLCEPFPFLIMDMS